MLKFTQIEIDRLADILWWIQGFVAAQPANCVFSNKHIEALQDAIQNEKTTLEGRGSEECQQ